MFDLNLLRENLAPNWRAWEEMCWWEDQTLSNPKKQLELQRKKFFAFFEASWSLSRAKISFFPECSGPQHLILPILDPQDVLGIYS